MKQIKTKSPCRDDQMYTVYLTSDHDAANAMYAAMRNIQLMVNEASEPVNEMRLCQVTVMEDCRIPEIFHGSGKYAVIATQFKGADTPKENLTICFLDL